MCTTGLLACVKSGHDNPDSNMGCYAMQPEDYDRFKPFFSKVLAEYHGVAEDAVHKNNWDLAAIEGLPGLPTSGQLDVSTFGLPPLSMRVRVGRNLKDFPLPGAMDKQQRMNLETKMCTAFNVLKAMSDYGGRYHSLTPGRSFFAMRVLCASVPCTTRVRLHLVGRSFFAMRVLCASVPCTARVPHVYAMVYSVDAVH